MKKFICTIPLQVNQRELEKVVYDAVDNPKLVYGEAVSFPIVPVINGYVNDGEKIELLVLKQKAEGTDLNYEAFQKQVSQLCDKRGIIYENRKSRKHVRRGRTCNYQTSFRRERIKRKM